MIGKENLQWLATEFSLGTGLKDLPEEILDRASSVDITIRDYTKNVIFKGVTLQGIIGRRMYSTWYKMLDLLRAGLDVDYLVSREYDSLEPFHEGMNLLESRRAMKIIFYPNGR